MEGAGVTLGESKPRRRNDLAQTINRIAREGGWAKRNGKGKRIEYFVGKPGDEQFSLSAHQISSLVRSGRIKIERNDTLSVQESDEIADFIQPIKHRTRPCMKCRTLCCLPQGIYRCAKCHDTESDVGIRRLKLPTK